MPMTETGPDAGGAKDVARLRDEAADLLARPDVRDGQLRVLWDQDRFGLAAVDKEGRFLRVNARFARLVGRSPREIEGKLSYQQITNPLDLADDTEQANAVFRGEINGYTIEKRYIHKQGHEVWIELTVMRVAGPGGEFFHHLAIVSPRNVLVPVGDLPAHGRLADEAVGWVWRHGRKLLAGAGVGASGVVTWVGFQVNTYHQVRADLDAARRTTAQQERLIERLQERLEDGQRDIRRDLRKPVGERGPVGDRGPVGP